MATLRVLPAGADAGAEHRCPSCGRLLLRGQPDGRFTLACKCKARVEVVGDPALRGLAMPAGLRKA